MAESAAGAAPAPPLRALLVGIDRYLPAQRSDLPRYPSLRGSVRDVEQIEQLLTGALEVPPERIHKLTAPLAARSGSPEPTPTCANLVGALHRLEAECAAGEQALIYYSGHGGRAVTTRPDLKGPRGLDECLVPMDIGDPAVAYIRDFEVNAFLARMEAKGVFVTLVFDCCHSGGIPRRNLRYRGIDREDRSPRPVASRLAGDDEITAAWTAIPGGEAVRSVRLPDTRFLRPSGYALLAACRPQELAIEDSIDGAPPCGALTYYLLAALREQGRGATYRGLHAALVARIHTRYPAQTPMLEGEGDRLIFGREELPTLWGINVLDVEAEGRRLLLNTGAAQGVRVGARFAFYPASARDAAEIGARLATGVVEEVGSTSSWLKVEAVLRSERAIREGDQALVIDPGPAAFARRVELVARPAGEPAASWEQQALDRVAVQLRTGADGLLTVCGADQAGDFQLSVDTVGCYRISDAAGHPVPNLGEPKAVLAPNSAREVVRQLRHLAQCSNLRTLNNPDSSSPLHGRLRVSLEELPGEPSAKAPPTMAESLAPVPAPADPLSPTPVIYEVANETWVRLTIHNDSPDVLNVAVLDLQPDWGVSQIFPAPSAGTFHPLDPGNSVPIPLQTFLPEGLDAGTDVLKVFAATGPVSFRWLELPALHDPAPRAPATGGPTRGGLSGDGAGHGAPHLGHPTNPLERLLAALGSDRRPSRAVRGSDPAGHEWETAQVELRVVREDSVP